MSGVGFVVQQVDTPAMETLDHTVNLLADITILVLALLTIRHRFDWLILASFTLLTFMSTCMINHLSLATWVNGSRVFFGVLFVPIVLRYIWDDETRHDRFIARLDKHLYIFLLLMAFTMTIQYMQIGAGDYVGGIFGPKSGIASICIYCVSFYLLRKNLDTENILSSLAKNWRFIVLLYPTFLNETKISLVLIVLYFTLLIPIDRKLALRLILGFPLIVLVGLVGVTSYMAVNQGSEGTNLYADDFVVNYLIDDTDEAEVNANYALKYLDERTDIPRMVKIVLMVPTLEENQVSLFWGLGLGLYKGGTTLEQTEFAIEYQWLIEGTSPYVFHIFMQLGWAGAIWTILLFLSFYLRKPPLYPRRDMNIQLFFTAVAIALLVYADLWRELAFAFPALLFLQLSWTREPQAEIAS